MPENAPTTPTAPTLNEQEKKSDRIYRFIISALCFAMCTVQIVNVIYPFFISSEFFVIHFMFGMLMCYLVYDYKGKKRYFYSPAKIFDIILPWASRRSPSTFCGISMPSCCAWISLPVPPISSWAPSAPSSCWRAAAV